MISIKRSEDFLTPDPGSQGLAPPLEQQYEITRTHCALHDGVPEDVRSYFNVVVMLYLYGWLYYPFYAVATERSFFAVEMALRLRFPPKALDKKGRDLRPLTDLFKEAKAAGFNFPNLDIDALIRQFHRLRNKFAHPKGQDILVPGFALNGPILAAEVINQLWSKPAN